MKYVKVKSSIIEATLLQYKKGARVIVNFNTTKDPEYYVGTVTQVRKGLVYVVFDDGDKGNYKPTRSLVGLVGITKSKKKRKTEIPVKDINKWLDIDMGKASPKRKPKTNVVEKKQKPTMVEKDSIIKKDGGYIVNLKLQPLTGYPQSDNNSDNNKYLLKKYSNLVGYTVGSYKDKLLINDKDTPSDIFFVNDEVFFVSSYSFLDLYKAPKASTILKLKKIKFIENRFDNFLDFVAWNFTNSWIMNFSKDLPRVWDQYKDIDFSNYIGKIPKILYRGLRFSSEGIQKIINKNTVKLKDSEYSSWTTSKAAAIMFARGKTNKDSGAPPPYQSPGDLGGAVISCPSNKLNVFFNMNTVYDKFKLTNKIEKEVIIKGPGIKSITPDMVEGIY